MDMDIERVDRSTSAVLPPSGVCSPEEKGRNVPGEVERSSERTPGRSSGSLTRKDEARGSNSNLNRISAASPSVSPPKEGSLLYKAESGKDDFGRKLDEVNTLPEFIVGRMVVNSELSKVDGETKARFSDYREGIVEETSKEQNKIMKEIDDVKFDSKDSSSDQAEKSKKISEFQALVQQEGTLSSSRSEQASSLSTAAGSSQEQDAEGVKSSSTCANTIIAATSSSISAIGSASDSL